MPNLIMTDLTNEIESNVLSALKEDMGSGDITAQLIPADSQAKAVILSREKGVVSGSDWVNCVFKRLDPDISIKWKVIDGSSIRKNQTLLELSGSTRALLSGERTALNFLQMLSGVTTTARQLSDQVKHTKVKLLDTRKSIPGLRLAQKYAVTCGGCFNHRIGLYDAFLIKENHIIACGGIAKAISIAKKESLKKLVEVEVENLMEFEEALEGGADIIMLDNFVLDDIRRAVQMNNKRVKIEASGAINEKNLVLVAETGVDYISIGLITKNIRAIDLSMRIAIIK